jgi:hypothetical protein
MAKSDLFYRIRGFHSGGYEDDTLQWFVLFGIFFASSHLEQTESFLLTDYHLRADILPQSFLLDRMIPFSFILESKTKQELHLWTATNTLISL